MSNTAEEEFSKYTKHALLEVVVRQDKKIAELHDAIEKLTKPTQPQVGNYLEEALQISGTNSNRGAVYGHARDNFHRIANLVTAQLGLHQPREGLSGKLLSPITLEEVALIMDHVKNARLQTNPKHRDSWVDKGGYVNCVAQIHQLEDELANNSRMGCDPAYFAKDSGHD